MREQELREKIVKILEEYRDWFIEEDYKRDIAKIDYTGIADALITAGIGDVEHERFVFKKAYMDFFIRFNSDKEFRNNFYSVTLGCQIRKFEDMMEKAEKELAEERKDVKD